MARATECIRVNYYKNSMPIKNRKTQNQDNTIRLTLDKEKVLTIVGAFFVFYKWFIINRMTTVLRLGIIVVNRSEKVACFDLKIEHPKLHRNKEKNSVMDYRNNQQLKGVVSFFLVQW